MDSRLEPHCAPCYNFRGARVEEKVTVWLAPRSIIQEENRLIINWFCNWGKSCENMYCSYACKEEKGIGEGS